MRNLYHFVKKYSTVELFFKSFVFAFFIKKLVITYVNVP